jgi:hypothetical protein
MPVFRVRVQGQWRESGTLTSSQFLGRFQKSESTCCLALTATWICINLWVIEQNENVQPPFQEAKRNFALWFLCWLGMAFQFFNCTLSQTQKYSQELGKPRPPPNYLVPVVWAPDLYPSTPIQASKADDCCQWSLYRVREGKVAAEERTNLSRDSRSLVYTQLFLLNSPTKHKCKDKVY